MVRCARLARRPAVLALLPLVVAAVSLRRGCSGEQVFFARDLSFFYWPVHLWFRRSFVGEWPLWDPGPALGQSAVADAARQLFFPPALLVRLLMPAGWGFNLLVAAPVALAGLGVAALLARRVSPLAASFGGCLFTLSGPVLSSANSLNLSWSIAGLPWVLWAAERLLETGSAVRLAGLSAIVALQWLAGEPATAAGTLALTALLAAWQPARGESSRIRSFGRLALGVSLGLALTAIQTLPLLAAVARSPRGEAGVPDLLSLHPLLLVETLLPRLFGDPFGAWRSPDPWLGVLSDGSLPLFLSTYLGVPLLVAAGLGAFRGRERGPWLVVVVAAMLLALGRYAPVVPGLQTLVPVLRSVRYPAKALVFAVLGLTVLAAWGLEALGPRAPGTDRRPRLRAGLALLAPVGLAAGWLLVRPGPAAELIARQAGHAELAAALVDPLRSGGLHLGLLALATLLALLPALRPGRRIAPAPLLFVVAVADLLAVHDGLNPVLSARLLGEPGWARLVPAGERVYVGGRVSWATGARDADDIPEDPAAARPAASRLAVGALYAAEFASFPGAWGVREAVSLDLTQVRSRASSEALSRFARADAAERRRFLDRAGVRFFLMARAPGADAERLLEVPRFRPVALYSTPAAAPRAFVVPEARLERDSGRAIDALFRGDFDPRRLVLLDGAAQPEAAGRPGPGLPPSAAILEERAGELRVRASVSDEGGFLVLLDGFDPGWRATADGGPAAVLRANGLFRSVRLAPGEHEVRFRFAPASLTWGALVSALAFVGLGLALLRDRKPARMPPILTPSQEVP